MQTLSEMPGSRSVSRGRGTRKRASQQIQLSPGSTSKRSITFPDEVELEVDGHDQNVLEQDMLSESIANKDFPANTPNLDDQEEEMQESNKTGK